MKLQDLIDVEIKEPFSWRGKNIAMVWTPDNVSRQDFELLMGESGEDAFDLTAKILGDGIASWGLEDIEPDSSTFMRDDFPPMLIVGLAERLTELMGDGRGKSKQKRGR